MTANAVGLPGASVHVFDAGTYTWIGYAVTGAGGPTASTLPAGTYKLFVQPDEAGYADQWVGGSDHAGAAVADLSTLPTRRSTWRWWHRPPPTPSGTVTADAVGSAGRQRARVRCRHVHLDRLCRDRLPGGLQHQLCQPARTSCASSPMRRAMPTRGRRERPCRSHRTQPHDRQPDGQRAAGGDRPATHTLGHGDRQRGRSPGASVHVFDAGTYTWIGYVVTGAGGAYSIDLPAGTYKLFVQPDEAGYADQWVGGSDHATPTWPTSRLPPDGQRAAGGAVTACPHRRGRPARRAAGRRARGLRAAPT